MSEAVHVDVCVPNFQTLHPSGWGQKQPLQGLYSC